MEPKRNDSNDLANILAPGLFKRHWMKLYFSSMGENGEGGKLEKKSRDIQRKPRECGLVSKGKSNTEPPNELTQLDTAR